MMPRRSPLWSAIPIVAALAPVAAPAAAPAPAAPALAAVAPERFARYYPGPPCPASRVDRTWSQFQVNLGNEAVLVPGMLMASTEGGVVLVGDDQRPIELLTNASRADWLLDYPFLDTGVAVWGQPTLGPGCIEADGALYVESLFPVTLLEGGIRPTLDLMARPEPETLLEAVRRYRWALGRHDDQQRALVEPARAIGAADRLQEALFDRDAARGRLPWRVRLMGPDDPLSEARTVDVLLSGADGSTGLFGHISVATGGIVYNIYPNGSDRGAPDLVPLWDYLFNAQRGMAIRRPTWLLRMEGLPAPLVAAFDDSMRRQLEDIRTERTPYHPTKNNCTIASLNALTHLGFDVPAARYFTRRFPRPAFAHILERLPGLLASGRLSACRIELIYIPQVPTRPAEGSAPNRPIRDRGRIG